jgi:cytochrome c556
LTQDELKELISLLPEGFITMDRAFHGTAGKLSTAAASGDFASAIDHYATMSRACVSCHATYAAKRFPSMGSQ